MKQLLLLLLSCFSIAAVQAQNDGTTQPKKEGEILPFRPRTQPTMPLYRYKNPKVTLPSDTISLRNFYTLGNRKPGVYRLPQDNMPCIVPDSTKTVRIPNAWKGPVKTPYKSNPPRMPNLSTRPDFLKHSTENTSEPSPR